MTRAVARTRVPARTDRDRINAVLEQLAAHGVAYWFDMRGGTGVREDRFNDYIAAAERAGTDRWVGEHVGHRDCGGAFWDDNGVLCGRGDFG